MHWARNKLLTTEERKALIESIDIQMLGLADAKEATITDYTIEEPEHLLDCMSGYDNDISLLISARKKLSHGLG